MKTLENQDLKENEKRIDIANIVNWLLFIALLVSIYFAMNQCYICGCESCCKVLNMSNLVEIDPMRITNITYYPNQSYGGFNITCQNGCE